MKNVTVETKLTINLTAGQWQLYAGSVGATEAAAYINTGVQQALNDATKPGEAYTRACDVLRQYSRFGAVDSEPLGVLDRLMGLRFPGEWE